MGTGLRVKVIHSKTFQSKEASGLRYDEMTDEATQVVHNISEYRPDDDAPFDIGAMTGVHKSHYGIGAVIELHTGPILDYEVLSIYYKYYTQHDY